MKKINLMKNTLTVISAALALAFSSCNVGLGDAIDLEAPVVTIDKPGARQNVPEEFEVSGTVRDNTDVTKLVLTVGDNTWTYEKGAWTFNDQPYEDADWTPTGNKSYNWEVRGVHIDKDGEYVIRVSSYDENGNTSDKSVAQRTVIYDMNAPKVSITSPTLYPTLSEIKSKLGSYTAMPATGYQNYSMLENFINGEFEISGNQEETFTLKFLRVYIKDETDHDIWKSPLYVTKESYVQDAIGKGVFEEGEKYEISGAIRSFNFNVPDFSVAIPGKGPNTLWGGLIESPKYLKVVTVSSDASGNLQEEEDTKSHKVSQGWFCYYPQADKPWIKFDMIGTKTEPYMCYPGTTLQGYSYDDDGIESVEVNITCDEVTTTYTPYTRGTKAITTYQTWDITAPKTSNDYYVEVVVTDINGKKSDVSSGYFKVTDVNFPNISITNPKKEKTLFGDKNGSFTFDITTDDDSGISKILCVLLKEESDAAHYLNPKYANWEKIPATTTYEKPYIDATSKNKHWYIKPSDKPTPESASSARQIYKPELPFTLNLFSVLGIDGKNTKLGGQHFIFYVEDISHNALTYDYAIQGDMEVPDVTIDTISVTDQDNNTTKKKIADIVNTPQANIIGSKILLEGTFSDDSMETWQDPSKIYLSVQWNDIVLNTESGVTFKKEYVSGKNGKWSAEFVCGSDYVKDAGVSITAEIADYAANSKSDAAYFTVDVTKPILESITAKNASGTYKTADKITIVLKFNKPITVYGSPILKLNNGKEATFVTSSNDTRNLEFSYTIAANDDVPNTAEKAPYLDVTQILTNGATFKDASQEQPSLSIGGIKNLADNKKIEIVTKIPTLANAQFVGDDALVLRYSSSIIKNSGTITLTQTEATLTNVPAILTETQFKKWDNGDNTLKLADYYTKGTNGADNEGNADLTTKYILKYGLDSNDADLVASYKKARQHIIEVDIMSSAVTISANNLNVALTGSYALPCKGATYTLQTSNELVANVAKLKSPADTRNVTHAGVEVPVIRIQKERFKFKTGTLLAEQPLTSKFKIDCQTTGATIEFKQNSKKFPYENAKINGTITSENSVPKYKDQGAMPSLSEEGTYTGYDPTAETNVIGDNDWTNGLKIFFIARATKGEKTATSYEMAYRSVFVFDEATGNYHGSGENERELKDFNDDVENHRKDAGITEAAASVWIRGGDAETGPVTTAGFPLSWNEDDYKNGTLGAALLTKVDADADYSQWYYVTWELTTTAYIGVMAGVTVEDSETKGPYEWCYGKNSWVPFKKWYCLYPGESRYVSLKDYSADNGKILGKQRGAFGFRRETVDRNGNKIAYAEATTGGGGNNPEYKIVFDEYKLTADTGDLVKLTFDVTGISKFQLLGVSSPFSDWEQVWENNGITDRTVTITWEANATYNDEPFEFSCSIQNPINGENFDNIETRVTITNINFEVKQFSKYVQTEETLDLSCTEDGNQRSQVIAASYFTDITAETILILTISNFEHEDKDKWIKPVGGNDWNEVSGIKYDTSFDGDVCTIKMYLTDATVTKLKADGLRIQSKYYGPEKITSIKYMNPPN